MERGRQREDGEDGKKLEAKERIGGKRRDRRRNGEEREGRNMGKKVSGRERRGRLK